MLFFEPGLYVHIEELENGPKPFPLQSGFSLGCAYRALVSTTRLKPAMRTSCCPTTAMKSGLSATGICARWA